MITRYTLRAGHFIEDVKGFWVVHSDHVHEVARAIAASEERNRRFAAQVDALQSQLSARDAQIAERDKPCVCVEGKSDWILYIAYPARIKSCPYCSHPIAEAK